MATTGPFAAELKVFEQHRKEWAQSHPGEYVAIQNDVIVEGFFSTYAGSVITAIGATHHCGEHAGAISFPGTDLQPLDPIRIVSAVFAKERYYACLIGRDILRNWVITFDGRSKKITITD